ncbi:hypothetical protein [Pseudoclavibacter albus]|uniref:hypothetical protein n=1 Tax=Pseudoclavibacter albus TaxID=272241 RepID=UPI0008268891|nr:hypothetical protein [Pseudoclavibacter alba]
MSTHQDGRLSDGQAFDRMIEQSEKWAKRTSIPKDESSWRSHFTTSNAALLDELTSRSTASARRFTAKDWILGIVLWIIIAMTVFVLSVFLMQLSGTTTIIFGVFAILIAIVGFWQSYQETSSERRAERRMERKRAQLVEIGWKRAERILTDRAANGA